MMLHYSREFLASLDAVEQCFDDRVHLLHVSCVPSTQTDDCTSKTETAGPVFLFTGNWWIKVAAKVTTWQM